MSLQVSLQDYIVITLSTGGETSTNVSGEVDVARQGKQIQIDRLHETLSTIGAMLFFMSNHNVKFKSVLSNNHLLKMLHANMFFRCITALLLPGCGR